MYERQIFHEILKIGKRLNEKNMLAAADGNISYRVSDDRILITPTAINKSVLLIEQMSIINIKNEVLRGAPSTERLMHLEVYRKCPKARAVVHAHPPTAIAWSIAHPQLTELPCEGLPEVILAVGGVPIVPYARPGTMEMGFNLHPYLPLHRVMVLSRHGGLSWGEDLQEAYDGMERLEHSAHILKLSKELGGITNMQSDEIEALRVIRAQSGGRTL